MFKRVSKLVLIIFASLVLVSCGDNEATYAVVYDSAGGSNVSGELVQAGSLATLPTAPTRDNYSFVHWTLDDQEFTFDTPITENIILIAKWEPVATDPGNQPTNFTVRFEDDVGNLIAEVTVEEGKLVSKPADPVKAQNTFLYWTLNDNEFDFNNPITTDLTLVTKWEPVAADPGNQPTNFTVRFEDDTGNLINEVTVEEGKLVSKPADPVKAQNTFLYWTLNDNEFDFNNPITTDLTLVTKWEPVAADPGNQPTNFTVRFEDDTGNLIDEVIVEEGKLVSKPNDPVKVGNTFLYWTLNNLEFDFNNPITTDFTLVTKWGPVAVDPGNQPTNFTVRFEDDTGNLTLTGYNSTLSNKSFDEKKETLIKYSKANHLNKDILNCEIWNEKNIITRTKRLGEEILKIFEVPEHDGRGLRFEAVEEFDLNYNYEEIKGRRAFSIKFIDMDKEIKTNNFRNMLIEVIHILDNIDSRKMDDIAADLFNPWESGKNDKISNFEGLPNNQYHQKLRDNLYLVGGFSSAGVIESIRKLMNLYNIDENQFVFYLRVSE